MARIIYPAPVHGIAVKACGMLGLPCESAVLVGSSLLLCEPEDIDVGIAWRDATAGISGRLNELIASHEHQVYHDYFDCAHQKQFLCDGKKIDLFPLYSESDDLPDFSYTTDIEGPFLVEDIVTDASDSAFRPSFCKLAGGVPIVTYQIEHMMVLHEGDIIRTHAWRTPQAFLVRMGDPYEDITPRRRFIAMNAV
ncbi:MAG: hypothetical protein HY517_01015 [Candidatus Aenigmarchaeota archaeon]|nr:hypothetical protein [Candidatus Aenigmarchaeota archaeon]